MDDIELFGIHYLQQISDRGTGGAIHTELGGHVPPPGTANGFAEYNLSVANMFRTTPTPSQVTQETVTDPNSLLAAAIEHQTITETVILDVSTDAKAATSGFGGAENIPFLRTNADVARVTAILWIETVQQPAPYSNRTFLQLQYSQTVILNFLSLSWPHVSVATLKKVT
jgi:hypothetical protein